MKKLQTTVIILTVLALAIPATSVFGGGVIKQEVNSGWTFKQLRGNSRYPATVPGVVHTDLLDNKIIDDPFFRLNERGVQWVDKEDWEYQTAIDVSPEMRAKKHIELYFTGLDTYADVYLNDSCILKANNMFREWRTEIKPLLGDKNLLRIVFRSPIREDLSRFDSLPYRNEAGNDQSENGGIFDKKMSVFARKAGYHYGWDWGPRLVTSGIWRPVYLVGWDDVRIESVHYVQEKVTAQEAQVKARVEFLSSGAGLATLKIKAAELADEWTTKTAVHQGLNTVEVPVRVKKPRLWWSNGLGEAYLYSFSAEVALDGVQSDVRTDKIGLRDLRLIREKDAAGYTFYFRLNGVNVFAKGANYIPQDSFLPRVTPERYEKTIRDAVDANMNMLRIWGGGIYENGIFYELCDKYGILVWQDFMFACSTYPLLSGTAENIRQEAIDNVKRLRNHACIALWCGNNENHAAWFGWGWTPKYQALGVYDLMRKDYKEVFHNILPSVVAQYDPTRFYWPSSPYSGNPDAKEIASEGDVHYWGVWHAKDSIANYNVMRARFFSEYGFQSFPEYRSVLEYAPETRDHDIFSEVMMAHQRGGSHANGLIEWYLLNEYRKPADFRNFLYMGQILQGDAIKTAIEAHRRDMPYCMGTLFWQHNDCWPVASWSSRDYYGRWKAQHYFAKKAFDNILVSPITNDGKLDVYLVSDKLQPVKGVLTVKIIDLRGRKIYENSAKITLSPNSSAAKFSKPVDELLQGAQKNAVVVNARFTCDKGEVYTNNYFLSRCKDIDFPDAEIAVSTAVADGGIDVTLKSDVFVRGVFLSLDGLDNFFADNYFDLLPDETVTVRVKTAIGKAAFDKQLKIESVNRINE